MSLVPYFYGVLAWEVLFIHLQISYDFFGWFFVFTPFWILQIVPYFKIASRREEKHIELVMQLALHLSVYLQNKHIIQWYWTAIFSPLFVACALLFLLYDTEYQPKFPLYSYQYNGFNWLGENSTEPLSLVIFRSYSHYSMTAFVILLAIKLDNFCPVTWQHIFMPLYMLNFLCLAIGLAALHTSLFDRVMPLALIIPFICVKYLGESYFLWLLTEIETNGGEFVFSAWRLYPLLIGYLPFALTNLNSELLSSHAQLAINNKNK